MTVEELQERIDKLIAEREKFVQQANNQVMMQNGAIAMLEQLKAELNGEDTEAGQAGEATA